MYISFFDKIPLSKHNSLRWDAFCVVTSEAILFAYGRQAYMSSIAVHLDV